MYDDQGTFARERSVLTLCCFSVVDVCMAERVASSSDRSLCSMLISANLTLSTLSFAWACVCMYVWIRMYEFMYVCRFHLCMYAFLCKLFMYVVCLYVCRCVCILRMYVCMHVCVYVCDLDVLKRCSPDGGVHHGRQLVLQFHIRQTQQRLYVCMYVCITIQIFNAHSCQISNARMYVCM